MGNSPSHAPVPFDGYVAVRASIEARFSQPPVKLEVNSSPTCCGAIGGEPKRGISREQQRCKSSRAYGDTKSSVCIDSRGAGLLPPTLSAAETTDTNSDGAPDEFESAAAADEMLGGLRQSFTRVKAPSVRAQSPLPFPSMASCSPTVSKRNMPCPQELQKSSSSNSNEDELPYRQSKTFSGGASPQSSSRPQLLTPELLSGMRTPVQEQAKEGDASEAPSGCVKESDMFCPLSPNSALGSITPTTVSGWGAKAKRAPAQERSPPTSLAETSVEEKNVTYGPACNHSPFLEGRALQVLLPFLFGPSLGTCMGVCVHWFMKISDGLADMCSPFARDFEALYGKYFLPLSATVKVQPLQTADGSNTRLDWVITAKVLPSASGSVLTLGYCFEYRAQPSSLPGSLALADHRSRRLSENSSSQKADGGLSSFLSGRLGKLGEGAPSPAIVWPPDSAVGSFAGHIRKEVPTFSVAVAPEGSKRRLWLHRDLCRFHGDETGQAVLTPLGPVCVGDLIEVPIVLANGIGLADLSTVRWLPIQRVSRASRVLAGPKAFEAASRGIFEGCGLEMQYVEWFDGDQYRHMTTERLKRAECMEPELQHLSTSYSGIDVLVRRSLYKAAQAGSVGATAQRAWGLQCQVLPADAPVVFPLTRKGLLHDRSTCLQLREGDILESYLTIGGANF